MDRIATTLLDVLGLLLIAGGAYYLLEPHMGRAALLGAGAVLLAGSAFASRKPTAVPAWPRFAAAVRSKLSRREGVT